MFIEKKHVLIVSDDPRVLAEFKMELMGFFDVNIAATGSAALTALEMYKMALAVIYIGENSEKAFSVFADISESARSKGVPIIFLAEKGNDADETNAFAVGAVDYTVRRRGTVNALRSRINLSIRASENERRISGEKNDLAPPPVASETVLDGKTILIADDVDLNREIIAGMLQDVKGLSLDFAVDGKEVVQKFAKAPNRYSLILMDIQMPVMDGIFATRTIRRLSGKNAREIPIIALTAADEEKEIASYLDSGMNGYIKKPMAYDQLINIVAQHCF